MFIMDVFRRDVFQRSFVLNKYVIDTLFEEVVIVMACIISFALNRLLLQIVGVAAAEINQQSCSLLYTNSSALHFLCQELAHLLLYVTHMFQSGK